MKIAILGAGAMGSAVGALLHKAGNQVTLVDVSRPAIEAVQSRGLVIQNKRAKRNPAFAAPDAEIARRLGRNPASVQSHRLKLGIFLGKRRRARRPWTPEEDALLGTASDTEIAKRLGRHLATVCIRRQKLGIPNLYWLKRTGGRQRELKWRSSEQRTVSK